MIEKNRSNSPARSGTGNATLKWKLAFEETLARISARFVGIFDLDDAVSASLADVGRLSGADRIYVFQFRTDSDAMNNTHEWCAAGVVPQIDNLQNLSSGAFPWWMAKLRAGETINIPDTSAMPAVASAEREVLERQDIKSLLVLPLNIRGELAGFIGLDNVSESGEWSAKNETLLSVVGQILGNALERIGGEEALRQSEQRYRRLFNESPVALWEEDVSELMALLDQLKEEGIRDFRAYFDEHPAELRKCVDLIRVRDVNQATLSLHQAAGKEELLGNLRGVFTEESYNLFEKIVIAVADGRTEFEGEVRLTTMTGAQKHVFLRLRLDEAHGDPSTVFLASTDITARKEAEEALRESHDRLEDALSQLKKTQEQMMQQERLAAVGQLAAGIAHDFNNILSTILGYSEVLQQSSESRESIQSGLRAISASGRRAADLVRQLLDFSRKSIRKTKQLDLESTVAEAARFLRRTIPEHIRITYRHDAGDYLTEADPVQIQQVIANLVLNARDAMPGGGEMRIELSRIEVNDGERCVTCGEPISGEWICLSIIDSGSGMAPDVVPHVFEPFYTTKDVGEGTGLGLSQVYGIVSQHDGHITVHSTQREGAMFTIYLPPAVEPGETEEEDIQPAVLKGHGETILLVEDEPDVLDAKKRMLKLLDYTVVTALNGKDALETYCEHRADIALVLSDMVMPDVAGEALFRALKAEDPDLKMIMMSGYPLGEKGMALLEEGVVAWFEKPVSVSELSQIVGAALSG